MPPYSRYQPQPVQGGIVGPAPSGLLPAPRSTARRIADFLESYRTAKDREKAAARERFLFGLKMMSQGIKMDRQKMLRDGRKAGLIQ